MLASFTIEANNSEVCCLNTMTRIFLPTMPARKKSFPAVLCWPKRRFATAALIPFTPRTPRHPNIAVPAYIAPLRHLNLFLDLYKKSKKVA
jgi:hypothetical protein